MADIYLWGAVLSFVVTSLITIAKSFDEDNTFLIIIVWFFIYGPMIAICWPIGLPWFYYEVVMKPKQPEAVAKAAYIRKWDSMLREEHTEHTTEPRREHIDHEFTGSPTNDEVKQLIVFMGIAFDGEHYHYNDEQYDHAEEAITAAINARDNVSSLTSLMNAAWYGKVGLVKALISHGADPKLTGYYSRETALEMATTKLKRAKDQHTRDTYQSIIDILKPISY